MTRRVLATAGALLALVVSHGGDPHGPPATQSSTPSISSKGTITAKLFPNCVDSIRDQATGGCLEASSNPAEGVLFPPPHDGGVNNSASGPDAFVGGGGDNTASGQASTIVGGSGNVAQGDYSFVGGGVDNLAEGSHSIVGGGDGNWAEGDYATVGGGYDNNARGPYASIPGGYQNRANGDYSFAAGYKAVALAAHDGAFVWSSIGTPGQTGQSAGPNTFTVYAGGGAYFRGKSFGTVFPRLCVQADVGIGTEAPGGALHVVEQDLGLAPATMQWQDLIIEDELAALGLHSSGATPDGSAIVLDDVDAQGAIEDRWAIYRESFGLGSDLHFTYGSNADWVQNNHWVTFTRQGGFGILTTDPAYTLECNGTAGKPGGGSWSNSSDRRLKKDIRPLEGALDTLLALRGVRFEYIDPEAIRELPGERIGMIAQEVEEVVPDWVDEGADGFKRTTFRGFEALTVEALRELRAETAEQFERIQLENEALRSRASGLEASVRRLLERAVHAREGDAGGESS